MKQKLFIFLAIAFVILVLIGLNAASYVQKPETIETELAPNRSTFNPGITGSQAFYSLLAETGRKVTRWQRPVEELIDEKRNKPATLVMIGTMRRPLTEDESPKLLEWVSNGGRLVVIDREPPKDLLISSANWKIKVEPRNPKDLFTVSTSDIKQMTAETSAEKPVQPTAFTQSVNAVQPSRFASAITFERYADIGSSQAKGYTDSTNAPTASVSPTPYDFFQSQTEPPPPPPLKKATPTADVSPTPDEDEASEVGSNYEEEFQGAPVVHIGSGDRNLLVDVPFGSGQIVFLSDPFITANGGISLVDNAQLAINVVTAGDGLIAFDEYHQGYGTNNNRFFQYFEGTPVIAIFAQFALLVFLVFLSQSRRFARAVPEPEPDRLSKLEYVSAMAELQRRTGAYDLAIDNIFSDFRRRMTMLLGLDNTANDRTIAALIAERINVDAAEVEDLFSRCEGAMHGYDAGKRETIRLVEGIRDLESMLGMKRTNSVLQGKR
jgi:uncharacterized protein DUF4350